MIGLIGQNRKNPCEISRPRLLFNGVAFTVGGIVFFASVIATWGNTSLWWRIGLLCESVAAATIGIAILRYLHRNPVSFPAKRSPSGSDAGKREHW
jgi:hypothetical protein